MKMENSGNHGDHLESLSLLIPPLFFCSSCCYTSRLFILPLLCCIVCGDTVFVAALIQKPFIEMVVSLCCCMSQMHLLIKCFLPPARKALKTKDKNKGIFSKQSVQGGGGSS
ncbi:hypothetical protein CDAR_605511 [Caerostris darwini]|uniref:Uncharacterized protein n=1 Tax=Caerostris darwini TaxID=1538125 RepID=A0AAV4RBB1_9ARAC|nr:hypothetical protein CDAR_605511 [Caerostris darwini]